MSKIKIQKKNCSECTFYGNPRKDSELRNPYNCEITDDEKVNEQGNCPYFLSKT
jgi:hypothetical protein